jgi:hypothetical protein
MRSILFCYANRVTLVCPLRHVGLPRLADSLIINTRHREASMYKWLIALVAIIYMGDPTLSYLELFGEMKDLIVAVVISLLVMPWVVTYFDH